MTNKEWIFYGNESTKIIRIECFNVHSEIRSVRTGPDSPEKFNDGPVRSMNLPDRCISDLYTLKPPLSGHSRPVPVTGNCPGLRNTMASNPNVSIPYFLDSFKNKNLCF